MLHAAGAVRGRGGGSWWPYGDAAEAVAPATHPVPLTAVPYFAWGNRQSGALRVWLPTA